MFGLVMLCLFNACSQRDGTYFSVRTMPMATGLLYEVFPSDDHFKYAAVVLQAERCAGLSDREVQTLVMDSLQGVVDALNAGILEYGTHPDELFTLQDFLYHGYLYSMEYPLEVATDYVICLFAVDDRLCPNGKVEREATSTKPSFSSDIVFDIHSHGRTMCIVPSNNDVYFYDIERKVDVMDQYYGMLDVMFWENIIMLERYGMLDIMLRQGKDSVNVFDLLSPQPGDTMYMAIGGYDDFFLSSQTEYYQFVCVSEDSIAVEQQAGSMVYNKSAERNRIRFR